ncbi:hypothetical protein H0H93_011137, partial [Arthromyces matolae]
ACWLSKIKCDLQTPCSNCISRKRECVFVNDPAASRAKLSGSQRKSSTTAQTGDVAPSFTLPLKPSVMSDSIDDSSHYSQFSSASSPTPIPQPQSILSPVSDSISSLTSPSPESEFFETNVNTIKTYIQEHQGGPSFEDVDINSDIDDMLLLELLSEKSKTHYQA